MLPMKVVKQLDKRCGSSVEAGQEYWKADLLNSNLRLGNITKMILISDLWRLEV